MKIFFPACVERYISECKLRIDRKNEQARLNCMTLCEIILSSDGCVMTMMHLASSARQE